MELRVRRAPYATRLAARRALLERAARRLVEICAELSDVRAIYAFGSYATDSVHLESDLDALIVRDTDLRRAERDTDIRLAFDVSIGLDLIVVTPEEFAERLPATSFGRTILASAVRLDASR